MGRLILFLKFPRKLKALFDWLKLQSIKTKLFVTKISQALSVVCVVCFFGFFQDFHVRFHKMKISRLCLAASSVIGISSIAAKEEKVLENPSVEKVLQDIHIGGPNAKSPRQLQNEELQKAITSAKNLCWIKMSESAIPGLVIGVSVDGKTAFKHGTKMSIFL